MAKKDEQSAAQVENEKLHGDDAPKTESRELEAHELTAGVAPRVVSDEELKAIEDAASEPTLKADELSEEDRKRVTVYESTASGATPSPDSADYVYRDIVGTSIVGHQEQVPRED